MLPSLVSATRGMGTRIGMNVVAFSGGVDSSLVAFLVHNAFPHNSTACLGCNSLLPITLNLRKFR